jgi:hypothetical protein
MRPSRLRAVAGCAFALFGASFVAGCAGRLQKADENSGPDAKRSGANVLRVNTPRTDEVSFKNGDRTDWYMVELRGRPGVLQTLVHWDTDSSDLMIDVFDPFGAQIAASPVRTKNAKQKQLLTQIDKPGVYYLRITAPGSSDGTVYTMEAKWDEPPAFVPPPPSVTVIEPVDPAPREPRRPREPRSEKADTTVQGRVVAAYREGAGLTLHLDKGSAAGLKVGMSGSVLTGSSGEDQLDGGTFKITQVLGDNKSVARSSLASLGKNTRFVIHLK